MKVTKTILQDARVRTLLKAETISKLLNKKLMKDLRGKDFNVTLSAWLHALSFLAANIICNIGEADKDKKNPNILNGFIDLVKSHINEFEDTLDQHKN